MKGDVVIVEEHHYRAARTILEMLIDQVKSSPRCFTITVAGESGSGKSETAKALAETFESHGLRSAILQQDDYFVYPPRTNDAMRRANISWVGTSEVRLDLLDRHLAAVRGGQAILTKPLVIYAEDRITDETLSVDGVVVLIAEGTYTTLLDNVDRRVFIDRNRLETLAARKKRAREPIEPFIEEVLNIEHAIISEHKARADIIITRDYEVGPLEEPTADQQKR